MENFTNHRLIRSEMQYILMDIITTDITNPYNGYYIMVSYHGNIFNDILLW